ncbi:MAG: 2-oxoglutarate dehydrogenase complex dihydrolipoyllysine-residue succinyltransferase [Chlamydiota bacterium]|nr:2-oxoglutarate dehydrogenase complex dihydrolipoyllysine-residue succinyltransferase [Chlamydiota bacterium]
MKVEIKVPAMGESITEATVGEILKPTGSTVAMDDEILELETDKVNQVLYAPQGGVVEISVNTEDVVTIGQVIGFINTAAASQKAETPPKESSSKSEEQAAEPQVSSKATKSEPLPESGDSARITREDYVKEISSPKSTSKPDTETKVDQPLQSVPAPKVASDNRETRKKMSRLREIISSKLVEVKQQTAMLTTFNEVDLSSIMSLRKKYQDKFVKENDVKLGFMSFFIKASVAALKEFPAINGYIDGNDIVYRHYYDISVAVGTDKGLVVPVVRECDKRSFANIEQEILSLATKARKGGLTVDDLQGGGFTITNGGVYGSLLSTPILNPPQSAILGMHSIQKRPVVVNDEIVIRPMMYLALSYDHRIVDGKEAVSFLVHIKNSLEDPARLLLGI